MAARLAARRHFPLIEGPLTLQTAELDVCGGELTDISPDIWEMAVELLLSVLVKGEPSVPAKAQSASAAAFPPALGDHQARVAINVYLGDASIDVRAKSTTSFRTILSSVLESLGIAGCPDDYRVLLDGHSCMLEDSAATFGYQPGDELDVHLVKRLVGGKPVIYLFSPRIVDASVRLTLTREWDLSVICPVVPAKPTNAGSETIEWTVRTHLDGSLTERNTGLDVAYLFWEALYVLSRSFSPAGAKCHPSSTNHGVPISLPPPAPLSSATPPSTRFCRQPATSRPRNSVLLPVSAITPYLDNALHSLGLHTEARTSFITYWLPSFLKHTHVALRFVPQAAYGPAARLEITPAPDVITRVFMVFKGVAADTAAECRRSTADPERWQAVVGVDLERALDPTLFRVLEWGGMEVLGR
ncbi:hypothetical protein DFH09DRAFT_1448658 [Mycena vulgaris]|nr:hypothetical protein DFH09DRAFT_1448658 [Mycena vulgaris]